MGSMYVVDPARTTGQAPPWAIAGYYPVDESGRPVAEFVANPDHRPSPLTLGIPEPANPLERALYRAVAGFGNDTEVGTALLAASVLVPVGENGMPLFDESLDREVVRVYTSQNYLPPDSPGWALVPVRHLAGVLTDRCLTLNSGSPLGPRLPGGEALGED